MPKGTLLFRLPAVPGGTAPLRMTIVPKGTLLFRLPGARRDCSLRMTIVPKGTLLFRLPGARRNCSTQDDSFPCNLVFEGETEFFDDRIGKNFAGHPPNFRFRFCPG